MALFRIASKRRAGRAMNRYAWIVQARRRAAMIREIFPTLGMEASVELALLLSEKDPNGADDRIVQSKQVSDEMGAVHAMCILCRGATGLAHYVDIVAVLREDRGAGEAV